jgi:hypothetical protein
MKRNFAVDLTKHSHALRQIRLERSPIMNTQTRREIRSGLIALALSGLLVTLGAALRGPFDLADPGSSNIRDAFSPTYLPGWPLILIGVVLHLYGLFGLYRYLTYEAQSLIAFLAFVLNIAGLTLALPFLGLLTAHRPVIAELYQQGYQEVIALLGVVALARIIGVALLVIAIWKDGRLPKWTAIAFPLGFLLAAAAVTFAIELLGAVLLLVSTGRMAWKGWQETAVAAGQ